MFLSPAIPTPEKHGSKHGSPHPIKLIHKSTNTRHSAENAQKRTFPKAFDLGKASFSLAGKGFEPHDLRVMRWYQKYYSEQYDCLWRYSLGFRMVFGGNWSDCSGVLFPRMGQGMGQNRKAEQGRVELHTLRPVSAVRRFDEKTPAISGFWQNISLTFCRDSGESCAEIAPLRQRKGLRGKRSWDACL